MHPVGDADCRGALIGKALGHGNGFPPQVVKESAPADDAPDDRQEIVYESTASDPLHEAVVGGEGLVQGGDRMVVARVFRPLDLLTALVPVVAARVVEAGIRETLELGLDAPGFRGSIIVALARRPSARRRSTIAVTRPGCSGCPAPVRCST